MQPESPPIAASTIPLAEFSRGHRPAPIATSSRVIAALLTASLYALLVFLATHRTIWISPERPAPSELVAKLMPDLPRKKAVQRMPQFLAHLIRPHAETVAPPVFTVASEAPVAPAQLQASAAQSSPLAGGVAAGTGTTGQAASANGSNGNGTTRAGCWDAIWAKSVTDHVGRYYFYPRRAAHEHATGVVFVHLVIRRSGRLDVLEVGTSSGNETLDQAATNMVRKAAPLPRIPDHMHAEWVDAQLPIDFGTGGQFKPTEGTCGG
jgi:protein TonB